MTFIVDFQNCTKTIRKSIFERFTKSEGFCVKIKDYQDLILQFAEKENMDYTVIQQNTIK